MRDLELKRKNNIERYKKLTDGLSPSQWPYNMTADEKWATNDALLKKQQDFCFNRH